MNDNFCLKSVIEAHCAKALNTLIADFGNECRLATALGVSRQAVNQWKKNNRVGAKGLKIITKKYPQYTKAFLRPDL